MRILVRILARIFKPVLCEEGKTVGVASSLPSSPPQPDFNILNIFPFYIFSIFVHFSKLFRRSELAYLLFIVCLFQIGLLRTLKCEVIKIGVILRTYVGPFFKSFSLLFYGY